MASGASTSDLELNTPLLRHMHHPSHAVLFLLHLALSYSDDRLGPDARSQFHCYAYDGYYLRDNDRYTRAVEVFPYDYADKQSARNVFKALFDSNTSARLFNVYSLRRA